MHLKNWSLKYPDKRNAQLSPAYDFVSTISYIADKKFALNHSRTKRFDEFSIDELKHLSAKAQLPERIVLDTVKETVERFHEHSNKEKSHLPLNSNIVNAIDRRVKDLPIAVV